MDIVSAPTLSLLGHALLGLLAHGPKSGYDLAQGLRDPVGLFWHAGHSQIYPELARLEAAGLVRHTVVPQADRPDKKVHELTPEGAAALRAWLAAPTDVPKVRDELVLKAFCVWLADPPAAARLLRDHARAHEERLAGYERRLADFAREAGDGLHRPASPWFGAHAVLRRGIGYEREYRDWCVWLADALEAAERPS